MMQKKTLARALAPLALLAVPAAIAHTTNVAASTHATGHAVSHGTRTYGRSHRGARDGVLQTVDGVLQDSIPARPSVAWTVGLTKRPGWVLSGDPLGLQLSRLQYAATPWAHHSALTTQMYKTPDGRDFYAAEFLVEPGYQSETTALAPLFFWDQPDHGQPTRQNVQNMSVSINGTQLSGQYFEVPLRVFDSRDPQGSVRMGRNLDIANGALHYRFTTLTLSQSDFLGVLGHLIGGRAHPDLVAHLQAELNAAPPSTPH